MHTVFALLCFVVVIHWLIFPYPSGLLHWHCGNLTIAPVPAKQPWWIWINTSCEFIMNDCITTTKQSTTKPCAYFLGYTVNRRVSAVHSRHITVILLYITRLSARWATELLWQPPEEYISKVVEMCVWNVSYCILLEIKLLPLRRPIALPWGRDMRCRSWVQI